MTKTQAIVDGVIVLALIVAYVLLSKWGVDANPILYILGGAAGRSSVQSTVGAIEKKQAGPPGAA